MIGLQPARQRMARRGPGHAGNIGAVLLFCLSLTPSLLPRHWALQGVVSGITMAIGYGAATAVAALVRPLRPRRVTPSRRAWAVLAAVAVPLAATFLVLGHGWQQEVRALVGAPAAAAWEPPLVVVAAVGVFALLLALARLVRSATRRLAATFGRFSPRPVASAAAASVVAALGYGLGPGVAVPGASDLADRLAAQADTIAAAEVTRPTSRYVSGGSGSLVPWDTLGAYGREFTATAVSRPELAEFTGGEASPPIRVYVGRDSAPSPAQRAELAVRELERTGAFDRSVLAVITTTGTGWVNPAVPVAVEYLYGGDSAVVATQYSYLPSWMSYLADSSLAAEAATALLGAVRERLAELPAAERPELVVYGESLGAYGVESAHGDLAELLAGTDGAVLAGPLHTNPLWREVGAARDPGSPVWRLAGGEEVVRAQNRGDLAAVDRPEVVFLQNASDPVSRWSPELLYRKPSWLDGDRPAGVSGAMRWFPVVTFWQVSVDLLGSTAAPSGHGHSYGAGIADAFAALVPPDGWTAADTVRLRALLADPPSR